jgi:hypothetical protein
MECMGARSDSEVRVMADQKGPYASPSALPLEDKIQILERVVFGLRSYQLIGILESRAWVELLFPEFAGVRDSEADEMFRQLANLSNGVDENVRSDSE